MSFLEKIIQGIKSSGPQRPKKVKLATEAIDYMVKREWLHAVVSEPDKWYSALPPLSQLMIRNNKNTCISAFGVVIILQIHNPVVNQQAIELKIEADFGYVSLESADYIFNRPRNSEYNKLFGALNTAYEANAFLVHGLAIELLSRRAQQAGIEMKFKANPAVNKRFATPEHAVSTLESLQGIYTQFRQ